jgi:hypothetical protein
MAKLKISLILLQKLNMVMKYQVVWTTGYVSFGKTYKEEEEGDLKEFWHFGQYVDKDSKYAEEYR